METMVQQAIHQKSVSPKLKTHKKKQDILLSNILEEYGVLDPRQWPEGVTYDSIHYLGDSATLQFFSNKLNLSDNKQWQGHTIKRFGDGIVLAAEVKNEKPRSKIPVFQWPKNIHAAGEDIHKYIYTVTGLDQYTTVRLLKIYFSHIHPILPVIDKTEFLKQYRDRVNTFPSGELLNAMFGAAARFVECESLEPARKRRLPSDAVWDVPVGWSNQFFDQAEYIISKWSTTPTVSMIQAIVLILNHRGDRDSKSSACWQLGGFAIRLAHLLGLHRNCDDWDVPRNEKETRKRIWWALYITDRFQTAILGRPINLRDEDINVSYPDSGADIEEVMDAYEADKDKIIHAHVFPRFPSLTTPYSLNDNHNPRPQIYELFVQFIKLAEILGRVLQGLHTPRAKKYSSEHGSHGLVTRLDFELTAWRYAFPAALKSIQLPDFNEDTGHFAPVIASMLLFYFSTLVLLHQPFICKTQSRSSCTSLQICTSAATRGMRIASGLTLRNFLMCPYSFTLYPIMQFGLIHMYNGKHPDPHVSMAAKLDLKKGTELLQTLQHMSKTAYRLYQVFKSITENADLHAEDDHADKSLADQESRIEEKIHRHQQTMALVESILLQKPDHRLSNVHQEAFTLTQFGFDTTNETSALDYILQNLNTLEPTADNQPQDHHGFRNDPNNVFWDLPINFDWDQLSAWMNNVSQ
ncbi:fungal-specific transcription factor domain-containing protein [Gilbertella persicaria]|nr:fungal-specific transcription factor domain-containing protein [Gilbertella persicaria]KAI8072175.1 fungal-specific transcription factor domain-containing protein [Gilbertella persicaria]